MIFNWFFKRNKSEGNSYNASLSLSSEHVLNSEMHMVLNSKNKSTHYPLPPLAKIETSFKF